MGKNQPFALFASTTQMVLSSFATIVHLGNFLNWDSKSTLLSALLSVRLLLGYPL